LLIIPGAIIGRMILSRAILLLIQGPRPANGNIKAIIKPAMPGP